MQRIGSVLTDDNGGFRVEYAADGAPVATAVRVAVFADAATSDLAQALYSEATPRSPAAPAEAYTIRIAQAALIERAVPVPVGQRDLAVHAGGQYALRLKIGAVVNDLTTQAGRAVVDPARVQLKQFQDQVGAALLTRGRLYPVDSTSTVQTRLFDTIRRSLTSRFKTSTRRVLVPVSTTERDALGQYAGTDSQGNPKVVPNATAEPLIFGNATATERLHNSLLATPCRDMRLPDTKCSDGQSDGNPGNGTGTPPPKPTIEDEVWRALATTPALSGSRPSADDVAHRVSGLQLASGPADVTALHDFQVLHMAFDHVWQDLIDDRVVQTATQLRQAVVRAGGSQPTAPQGAAAFSFWDPLDWALNEANTIIHTVGNALTGGGGGQPPFASRPRYDRNGNPLPPGAGGLPLPQQSTSGGGGGDHREPDPTADVQRLLSDLEKTLAEPYRFTVFAADGTGVAINFGLIVTYRQRWQPVTYQAGKLVSTVTLAPKEERSFSRKTTVTKKKKTDTSEKFRNLTKTEEAVTDRAVRDIVQTAQAQTGLDASYSGHGFTVTASHHDSRSSSDTKQSFREAVRRASAEYENDRSVQVTYETSFEQTTEETGKIVNPNAELAVTYLFYQLQRRFLVSERIHKLTPVVMVAQPVPKPSDITLKWLLQYDWILRKSLLDPSFVSAFDYLTQDLAGEEFSLAVLKQNVDTQQKIVNDLKDNLAAARNDMTYRYQALQRALAMSPTGGGGGWLGTLSDLLFGSNNDADTVRLREQIARDAYDRAVDAERSLEDQLSKESSLLTVMTDKWVEAQKRFYDKTVEVDRLRLHIKQNILYYMQAIWDHEPPDQRYFRLHQVPVPVLSGKLTYTVDQDDSAIPMPPTWTNPSVLKAQADITTDGSTVPLVEIADLDTPLGYKGNYMVFPMIDPDNILAKYMMVPYANRASGIQDPDQPGNITRVELDRYVCCLKKNLTPADLEAVLPGINEAYQHLLSDPRPSEEEIIVPTDSLYIEALPAAQPILEDYQMLHREADVERVRIENAGRSLDNVRHAARILGGNMAGDFDRNVLVSGARGVTVEDSDGSK